MRRPAPLNAALLTAVLLATPALAAPIDGTWKSDLATAKLSDKPDVYLLAKGQFSCSSCVPSYTVAADGRFHPVAGQDYWDEAKVTIVDANSADFAIKRKGVEIGTMHAAVSPDGKTLTQVSRDTGAANGTPVENSSTATRIAAAPAGAHALSGSWRRATTQSSEAGLNQSFLLEGDTLKLSTPTGESYAAKLGGPAVPIVGDPAGTKVQVRKVGEGYEETGFRGGKAVYRMTFIPTSDGKSLDVTAVNLRRNSTTRFTALKQ